MYIATTEKKKEEYEKTLRAYNLGLVFDLFFCGGRVVMYPIVSPLPQNLIM
jgi:hypothetical protein